MLCSPDVLCGGTNNTMEDGATMQLHPSIPLSMRCVSYAHEQPTAAPPFATKAKLAALSLLMPDGPVTLNVGWLHSCNPRQTVIIIRSTRSVMSSTRILDDCSIVQQIRLCQSHRGGGVVPAWVVSGGQLPIKLSLHCQAGIVLRERSTRYAHALAQQTSKSCRNLAGTNFQLRK